MSNYVKSTDFAAKDALASGNAAKIVKGTEIDTEFNNIATAVATKADLASPTFTGTPALPTGTTAVTQSAGNNTTAIATTAFVQAALSALYPVGSIYTNATSSTNPGTLLGFGTWAAFGAGRVMVGFDSSNALFDTAEETGGSANSIVVSHTHTADTQSNHQHYAASSTTAGPRQTNSDVSSSNYISTNTGVSGLNEAYNLAATGNVSDVGLTSSAGSHSHTISTEGSSGTNANYQPYITVYMWKRTA